MDFRLRGAPQNTESFDDAPKKPWVHFFILSDECLELPSDSVKKGITLKQFEKQCTVSSERCRGDVYIKSMWDIYDTKRAGREEQR